MLQKLWYDRPVRTQLLVAVGLINLLAAFAAVAVSILNTRTATRVEIEASLEVAQRFVSATIKDLAAQGKLDRSRSSSRLSSSICAMSASCSWTSWVSSTLCRRSLTSAPT